MNTKWLGFKTRTWIVSIAVAALLGTLALAAGSAAHRATKGNAADHSAWYADTGSREAAASTATPATSDTAKAAAAANYAKQLSGVFHEAAAKVLPSVVMITNTPGMAERSREKRHPEPSSDEDSEDFPFGFKGTPFGDLFKSPRFREFFRELPSLPVPEMPHHVMGAGSGVIVDPSGVILTNNHVVAGGGKVTVRLQDGREFKAVDIKGDPKTDLAVLRIEGAGPLPAARLGNSDAVEIGDWVLALGQPFGLEGTVTAGIVSAKSRGLGITDREDFIQTDAAINPGNSGGPLVSLDGEVIGINTAISTSNGGYQGVGFAIPVNLAKWVGKQLVEHGAVRRAYLGIGIQPVTQPLAEQFHVKVHQGVLVTEVQPNMPAEKAGLKPNDIVLEFAGQKVSEPRQLQAAVERAKIGSSEPLVVLRDGKRITLHVTCAEQPGNFALARRHTPGPSNNEEPSRFDKLGIQVEPLTAEVAEQLGIKADHGMVITEVRSGSPADMAGLTSGMVIVEANRRPLKTVDDFRKALDQKPLQKGVLLLLRTAEGSRFAVIQAETE
jgi:serine protease Do